MRLAIRYSSGHGLNGPSVRTTCPDVACVLYVHRNRDTLLLSHNGRVPPDPILEAGA